MHIEPFFRNIPTDIGLTKQTRELWKEAEKRRDAEIGFVEKLWSAIEACAPAVNVIPLRK